VTVTVRVREREGLSVRGREASAGMKERSGGCMRVCCR